MKKIIFLILLIVALLLFTKKVNGIWNENRIQKTYDERIDGNKISLIIFYDREKDVDCYVVSPDYGLGGSVAVQCIKNIK
jgi:hypothetical protein